jgi:rhodanese-related sulfurtransferase
MMSLSPRQRRVLFEALAILALGIALGFTVNYRLVLSALNITDSPPGLVLSPLPAPAPAGAPLPAPVELAQLQTLLAVGTILVDARIPESYSEGHLPGAISLPLDEVKAGKRSLPTGPKEKTVIVYCGGYGCEDSFTLALLLISAGYKDLRVFAGGYPQWVEAQLPIETGAP